jgi:uncharacterized protein (TIGR02145 family)
MKKTLLILTILASAFSTFAQDSLYVNQKDGSVIPFAIANVDSISFVRKASTSPVVTDYVVINGVKWATRNVNTSGTFTNSPEEYGMYYQWNSKVAYSATGDFTGWNSDWTGGYSSPSSSDTWTSANDPSPTGYRVPTFTEINSLLDETNVTKQWTTQNSVYGCKFTDKNNNNSIFLPAAGCITGLVFYDAGIYGDYWTSTVSYSDDANYLGFDCDGADWGNVPRQDGQSVRSVAESSVVQDSLYINQKGGSVVPFAIANLDSISFARKVPAVNSYVLINGVKWATRNLDTGGTFVTNPEDYGALYQWGRSADGHESLMSSTTTTLATSATSASSSFIIMTSANNWGNDNGDWLSTRNDQLWNAGTETTPVKAANDPCPDGYRVPTLTEIQTLLDATKVTATWTTQNGVSGEKFTDIANGNSIFLPAAGYRTYFNGTFSNAGTYGYYWSSTVDGSYAYYLYFSSNDVDRDNVLRADGRSLRPVAE